MLLQYLGNEYRLLTRNSEEPLLWALDPEYPSLSLKIKKFK